MLTIRESVQAWLKHLRHELPVIAFKASTQSQRQNLSQAKSKSENMLKTSECMGADTLMKLLKNYCRNLNIKTSITVGVVGLLLWLISTFLTPRLPQRRQIVADQLAQARARLWHWRSAGTDENDAGNPSGQAHQAAGLAGHCVCQDRGPVVD
jgi:hypothetical protein